MNFLAHALLAARHPAGDDALIAGGLAGDWIKGPLARAGLPAPLARGVALHRAIDAFAETHPSFAASRARCAPERRRWAGVLVDMFYDHLLARDFAAWDEAPLAEFSARSYAALARHIDDFPPAARPALRLMIGEDWLASYASRAGLADVLLRMSRRARFPNPLADGIADIDREGDAFERDFRVFMADAQAFVRLWEQAD